MYLSNLSNKIPSKTFNINYMRLEKVLSIQIIPFIINNLTNQVGKLSLINVIIHCKYHFFDHNSTYTKLNVIVTFTDVSSFFQRLRL